MVIDPEITKAMPVEAIKAVFDLKRHFKHVDMIINRALALGVA